METPRRDPVIPEIGIGMLGYAFMGKAHSNGFRQMPYLFWPPPAIPRLIMIAGRNEKAVSEAARRYGWESYTTDWHDIIEDDRIRIFDNGGPNITHRESCVEAAGAGKDIICEKPLARNAEEASEMLDAVRKAGVKHCCAFNCRMVPAVRLARDIIDGGRLGRIYHFRAQYFQEWIVDPMFPAVWRTSSELSGTGALGDFSHIVDLARFLCGEPAVVGGVLTRFVDTRPAADNPKERVKVDVDDAFVATVEFENGAIGVLEGSRFCPGRKNYLFFEINAENGSIYYDHEHLNYLHVYYRDEDPQETRGFHTVDVTESFHPYGGTWWPQGHLVGWGSTFVHEVYHMVEASVNGTALEPNVATFEDGYRAAVVCDAIARSWEQGKRVRIGYE
jgi:predicted dehydrogenase